MLLPSRHVGVLNDMVNSMQKDHCRLRWTVPADGENRAWHWDRPELANTARSRPPGAHRCGTACGMCPRSSASRTSSRPEVASRAAIITSALPRHHAARASLTSARRFATGSGYAKLAEAARFTGDRSGAEERSADQRAGVRRTGAERSLPGAPHA
jgi:hypothetical protein